MASKQLSKWASRHKVETATLDQGFPVQSLTATLGIGRHGPLLLQDHNFQEVISSFAQERIPERAVHAKGAGALGYFRTTNKLISKYTKAKVFQYGVKTPVVVRFSSVLGELGSADSVNDLRGLAVKLKTEDGNYDLTMLSTLNFNIREPMLFPSITHSRKRNPSTHLHDHDAYWDFNSGRPEVSFSSFLIFSDLCFPKNYRHLFGFAINTYKFTGGSSQEPVYVRFRMIPDQGKRISSSKTYTRLAGSDPDYFIRDLYNAIESKKYPSWKLYVQIMTFEQAKEVKFNPFDSTKIFPLKQFPLIPVGKMVLNQNPKDYFNEVEQVAFNPGNLVPGIEPSPDRLFHGRIFMYGVTQRHRLGKNLNQLPINCPLHSVKVRTYTRDGEASIYANGDGGPNYYPNTFNGPVPREYARPTVFFEEGGDVNRTDTGDEDNHSQLRDYIKDEISLAEVRRTVKAIAAHLAQASPRIQMLSLTKNWDPVSPEFSRMIRSELEAANAKILTKNKKKCDQTASS